MLKFPPYALSFFSVCVYVYASSLCSLRCYSAVLEMYHLMLHIYYRQPCHAMAPVGWLNRNMEW